MAKILSIVAPERFQQIEYSDSKKVLEESGHQVITASTHQIAFDKADHSYKMDILLDEVMEDDFDAVLFVGGPGILPFFEDQDFQSIARAFYEAGKLVTAICAAPGILAKAGILKEKRATCYFDQATLLKEHGAKYTQKSVERDGQIITGDGPESALLFGEAIAKALNET